MTGANHWWIVPAGHQCPEWAQKALLLALGFEEVDIHFGPSGWEPKEGEQ